MSNVVKRSTQMDSQRLHLDTLITVLYCWSVALMTLTHWYCCCRQLLHGSQDNGKLESSRKIYNMH